VAGIPGQQRQPAGSGVHGVVGVRRCQRVGVRRRQRPAICRAGWPLAGAQPSRAGDPDRRAVVPPPRPLAPLAGLPRAGQTAEPVRVAAGLGHRRRGIKQLERQVRNMINPYSTASARWWCHAARYMRLPRAITGTTATSRPGLPRPAVHRPKGYAPQSCGLHSSPSSPQAPNPWRTAAASGFGEADRVRRDQRERPRHGGRERDNEPPGKTAPHSTPPACRVSLTDQRRTAA
jgi:hypothetical protein